MENGTKHERGTRTVVVYYIDVGNLGDDKIRPKISLKLLEEEKYSDINELFIPTRQGHSSVEVLYV